MRRKILFLVVCLFLFIIGVIGFIFYKNWNDIEKLLGIGQVDNSIIAMDSTEASIFANETISVEWIDVSCPGGENIVNISNVYDNIVRSNAILLRSGATFKLILGNRSTLDSASCSVSINDNQRINYLISDCKEKKLIFHPSVLVFVVSIEKDPNSPNRTKGFSVIGSRVVFIDREELLKPTNTLMHEIGHAWSLDHPFGTDKLADVPVVCATTSSRVQQLTDCPTTLRTCNRALQDEMLNNVMDYLPERCGRKYYFSPCQIDKMHYFLSTNQNLDVL